MALARKRSRLITVDGVTYRWKVRHRPTYHQGNGWSPLTFALEHAQSPGSVLVVSLPAAHPGNWMLLPGMAIRPVTVAASVRIAIGEGWDPARKGHPFLLTLSESDLPARPNPSPP